MALPVPDPLELAHLLGIVDPDPQTVARLQSALDVATAALDPRVDASKVPGREQSYLKGVYGIAVRVWDASTKGLVDVGPAGDTFTMPAPAATAGLYRSVAGMVQPILKLGGVIVG